MNVKSISLKNLEKRKKWKKGESGNPKGKPLSARKDFLQAVKELMNDEAFVDKVLLKLRAKAQGGDLNALKFLADRGFGLPTQHIIAEKAPTIIVEHNVLQVSDTDFEAMRIEHDPYDAIKPKPMQLPAPVMVIDEQQLKSKTQLP